MTAKEQANEFTSGRRKSLLIEMARTTSGVTAKEAHQRAASLGDAVTEEAYYNIARRLAHRGLLRVDESKTPSRYFARPEVEGRWLEEDDLAALVDPDYPLLALSIANESARQMKEVPESVWIELRRRLRLEPARELFFRAIESYVEDFHRQLKILIELEDAGASDLPGLRQEAENSRQLLVRLVRFGLGLSREAVDVPITVDSAVTQERAGSSHFTNPGVLRSELKRRVSDENFLEWTTESAAEKSWLIGAVDGSTRGGMLSFLGEAGDFVVGHAPMVSINTAVGQVNRLRTQGDRKWPIFTRLPERPEDMQRQDNRFTVMAKLLNPDMSDAQYMHSVWNAMDLIETRTAERLLEGWTTPDNGIEVPAVDVLLRDGAVSPQDRDFYHYADPSTYGRIVREAIRINWQIAKSSAEDDQTVAGVVKTTQLAVMGPVLNWYASQMAAEESSPVTAWPMQAMNLAPDQVLLTHLLTAGRSDSDRWLRTCLIVRPFHALTNYSLTYSRESQPSNKVLKKHQEAIAQPESLSTEKQHFWLELFRGSNDPYVKMLEKVSYASFFLGAAPRLDSGNLLPRIEFVVNDTNREDRPRNWEGISDSRDQLISALRENKFDVAAEHSMFEERTRLDVLPSLLIQAHDTVKHWAADLLARVQEYIGYYLARYVKGKELRGVRVRPFTTSELKLLYSALRSEREEQAGGLPDADEDAVATLLNTSGDLEE